jgi:probable HAF family extracellular repeat protein
MKNFKWWLLIIMLGANIVLGGNAYAKRNAYAKQIHYPIYYHYNLAGYGAYPEAINDHGNIAGGYIVWPRLRAFLWTSDKFSDLGTLPGGETDGSLAYSINNNNQIVGQSYVSNYASNNIWHAFSWTTADEMHDLGILPGVPGSVSAATCVNDMGYIVGTITTDYTTATGENAFLWLPTGELQQLDSLGGPDTDNIPYSINNNGQIAGESQLNSQSSISHAVLWDLNGVIHDDLGTLSGRPSTSARIVNNLGQVMGLSWTDEWVPHAFFWTQEKGMIDLGTLGGHESWAYSMNDHGQVVGYATTETGGLHAFLWSEAEGMQDLNDIIRLPKGETLSIARAINNNGWITGNDLNGDVFLLTTTPIVGKLPLIPPANRKYRSLRHIRDLKDLLIRHPGVF